MTTTKKLRNHHRTNSFSRISITSLAFQKCRAFFFSTHRSFRCENRSRKCLRSTESFDPVNHLIFISEPGKRYGLTDEKPIPIPNIPNSLDRPRHDVKLPLFLLKEGGRCRVCHCGVPHRHDNYTVPVTKRTPT